MIIMQKTSYFYEVLMIFVRVKRKVLKFVRAMTLSFYKNHYIIIYCQCQYIIPQEIIYQDIVALCDYQ